MLGLEILLCLGIPIFVVAYYISKFFIAIATDISDARVSSEESYQHRSWINVWFWRHFPERQIYIREDGRVQFYTISPAQQLSIVLVSIATAGIAAFIIANVMYKDYLVSPQTKIDIHASQRIEIAEHYINPALSIQRELVACLTQPCSPGDREKISSELTAQSQSLRQIGISDTPRLRPQPAQPGWFGVPSFSLNAHSAFAAFSNAFNAVYAFVTSKKDAHLSNETIFQLLVPILFALIVAIAGWLLRLLGLIFYRSSE